MFEKVDMAMITVTQWFVRQIELFTSFNRDELVTKLISVSKFTERLSLFFFFDSLITNDIELIHAEKKNDITLPKEIITRRKARGGRLIQFTIFLLLFLATPFDVWILGTLSYAILLILEYLLCTTSLPPGEKQRREQEKEMLNMVPAAR